jgi:hypothetical protein
MRAKDEPARLAAWMKERAYSMAREVSQVAAEKTTELVDDVGHAVIDSTQTAARAALALGSDRLRDFWRLRNRRT